jgi:hypothetical protein
MSLFTNADLIHVYSREDALNDGNLVDVSEMAREAGFKYKTALTHNAFADCVEWTDEDNKRKGTCQDVPGRLWDVLYMARVAVQRMSGHSDRVRYQLYRVPREGTGHKARLVTLEAVIGPGDHGEPVITIQQPGED